MSGIPWESEASQNFIIAEYIVTNAVRQELRNFFIKKWNKRYQASLGAWDDTNVSGSQLFNLEKTRARPNKTTLQSKFQNGNSIEWDCTVLFDAILYSNSIGTDLTTTEKTEIDNLRELRNKLADDFPEKKMKETDFQAMTTEAENALTALGLSTNEVIRIKNHFASFEVLPPKTTHDVVSRSDLIYEMKHDLERLRSDNDGKLTYFYISGNPGSGKSQLSRQVCEDIFEDVNAMFVMTINGKDLDSLFSSYEEFGRKLNCIESAIQSVSSSSKTIEEKIKDLRSQICCKIKNWKKWWIIVDNVENVDLISPLLPQRGDKGWNNGQIILTTQKTDAVPEDSLSTKHVSLNLGMNEQECRELLFLISGIEVNDPLLDEVAERLDRQPLTMAAAAVYMRQVIKSNPNFSWREYLEKLEKGKRGLTEERLRQMNSSAYSSTMSTAVLLAVAKCAENNTFLKHAFNLFSLISFEAFPLDLVVKYIQQQENELDAEDIISSLKLCSLFVHVVNGDYIRLHRVVHEAVKTFFYLTKTKNDNNSKNLIYTAKTLNYYSDREDKIKMIPHLKAFHESINHSTLFPDEALYEISLKFEKGKICQVYEFFGNILFHFSEFELSMQFHHLTLKIRLEQLGPNHTDVATSYSKLGAVCYKKGDLEHADDYYQRALKIPLERSDPNYTDVATSYSKLGAVCYKKGDLEHANDYYQRAVKISLERLGPNHADVGESFSRLGDICRKKGDLEHANDYYQLALKIRLERLGPNHTDVATSCINIGDLCRKKGDLEHANDYYQRALVIRLERLGPHHADVADLFRRLGDVCRKKGDLEHANVYYQRALNIRLDGSGPNHTDVADLYSKLGAVCYKKGDLEHADEYYQWALKIRLEALGPNHTDVATLHSKLGAVCYKKGDLEHANDYYQRALKIRLQGLGPNHSDVATSYSKLGAVCYKKGDLEHANEYYKRALKIRLEGLGPNHTDVATSYSKLGALCYKKGDLEHANDYYQLALKIRLERLGPNHAYVGESFSRLGDICRKKGDLEHANDYYQRALVIRLKRLGLNHADVADSYCRLGDVCRKNGDLEQAIEYYQQASGIQLELLGQNHTDVAISCNNLSLL
ncbi:uncharacterized protein LOC114540337 [Dendronephthya gigantea]|uniref:uncharacterized protein LOC114540337 n=1 Tax=Dendronephthya gigantea TaxID=151771 RepID=UPI001068F907|nr:uncharacterized protein LOC114540337 [Dendronephthya gigantea]